MRTRTRLATLICACVLMVAVRVVRANPEPVSHNARSLGMGGVGTSLVGDGAAVFHNPAGLDDVDHVTLGGSLTPVFASTRAPWAGPGTQTRSELLIGPFLEFGGGVRLTPRFVLGLGAYALSGFGSAYEDVPALGGQDVEVAAFAAETSLPLVFRLLPELSVGFAPRLAIARLTSSTLTPMMSAGPEPPVLVRAKTSMWGVSPLGFQVGARYRPHPLLRLGFNYRSAMNVPISGTTETLGMRFDSESEYPMPHSFRFGIDLSLVQQRLILALDVRYMLYSLSHERITTTIEQSGMETRSTMALHWNDSFGIMAGAEYSITPFFPVRLGYNFTPSATPVETANTFAPVPGDTHGFSIGAGLRPSSVDIDFAALYSIDSTSIASGPTAGSYQTRAVLLSLSLSYHR